MQGSEEDEEESEDEDSSEDESVVDSEEAEAEDEEELSEDEEEEGKDWEELEEEAKQYVPLLFCDASRPTNPITACMSEGIMYLDGFGTLQSSAAWRFLTRYMSAAFERCCGRAVEFVLHHS